MSTPICPSCGTALVLTHEGDFDSWACPGGHGCAATQTESYERLQEDELHHLWQLARQASATAAARRCPICEAGMVSIEVGVDDDEIEEGAEGDGPDQGPVWLDVCLPCELLWFDAGELNSFPADQPDPEPTQAELDGVAKIRATFGQAIVDAENDREAVQITEHVYRRIARHKGLTHLLTEVGSLGRR
jgi:Zn-finger nucleic acid-binding protein